MVELPTGTVTFVFTDIEGSTRLWEEFPEAMQECLARHDEILRTAIDTHDGVIVKTTGDGVHAAFATAAGGVAAAVDAQCAMTSASWDDVGGLKIRIGVHTGEAEIRDGDYYGSALNRAARLMSVAHGGQIVLSHVTEELAHDALAADVGLVDLGEHRLRDLASPMRVLQIVHPALPRDFPRLRSLDAQSSNLPLQVTSFVGRDEDVATLAADLADAPLVTLTGTGGVGKTRLAIQVAAEIVPRFPDGAWFCELAAAADGELMAEVIANTLGCVQRPGLTLADSIVEYLKVRQTLVVLDNCEHVLDAAGALAESVLRTCPGTKILATSREALEIRGERVVRVRSLPAPDPATGSTALLESAAVQLFVDRAADAGARGPWDDTQMAAAGEICRRVDGIPLAIELAAARVAAMTPSEIAAHLDERFRLLTGSRRGRVERHQTLRATVEWSYQLLEPVERTVFDRLGVFAGSFEATGVVAVACHDDLDRWQAVDAVASLVAKSMLAAEDGPGGTTRYAMLETLRQFSRDQLDQTGEADAWRRRWAQYYAEFAETAGAGFKGADDELWAQRIYADLDNVRAAISWGLDTGDTADGRLADRMLVGLADFAQENRAAAVMARAADAIAVARGAPPELRSPALGLAAYHEMNQGNPDVARAIAEDALRDGVVLTSLHPFLASMDLAFIEMLTGNYERGMAVMNDARQSLSGVDAYTEARLLATVAAYEGLAGMAEQGRADAERAIELAQLSQNRAVSALARHGLAWALSRDEPEAALQAIDHYLEMLGGITTNGIAGAALGLAGGLRGRLGDPVGAVEALRGGVVASRDEGARPQVAATLEWSISVLIQVGRTEAAAVCMGALTAGALAAVSKYPSMFSGGRARALDRLRAALGDEATTRLVDQGAAMTYDEIVQYAIEHLEPLDA